MKKRNIIITATMLALFHSISPAARADKPKPVNETATTAAWKALDDNQYETAIKYATKCIAQFRDTAVKIQNSLRKAKAQLPVGAVDDDMKERIFKNGPLNDVGACYIVIGKASEKLGRSDDARKAYMEVKNFPYARVWDPQGWFWSPLEEAQKRLKN